MKVALVSSYDLEGGAARAALRLREALCESGVDASLSVLYRSSHQAGVHGGAGLASRVAARARWRLDQAPASALGLERGDFSVNWLRGGLAARLRSLAPDVVHLHWIGAGFVSVGEIAALRQPVVWTAHDMWPLTGGCHYDRGCGRYEADACTACPLQQRLQVWPLPHQRLAAKTAAAGQVHFIGPSRWMAGVAQRSPVARQRPVHVIPNAIDTRRFKPIARDAARALFGLPQDRTLLLFGAVDAVADERKGYAQLQAAIEALKSRRVQAADGSTRGALDGVALCVFGSPDRGVGSLHGLPVHEVGHLHDEESLVALYSAADLFVAPSLQDNLPNTVLEANACALPTVAFDVGGMADLIEHRISGWLAPAGDASMLADGLAYALHDSRWRQAAGRAARAAAVARFDYGVVAAAHGALYRQLLACAGQPAAVPGTAP